MTSPRGVRDGASQRAIMHHYDVSEDFFGLWLGEEMVYSCAWWGPGQDDTLEEAQLRKLDFFGGALGVEGCRVLDVGCGWGALLDRFVRVHGAAGGVGITLSPSQARFADERGVHGVDFRLESWVDHDPDELYDVVTCVEATEHFASHQLSPDEKVEIYRAFFARAASWLRPGGRMGLQLICLDNAGPEASGPGSGPFTDLILGEIFPESMSASLSELVLGWDTHFELDRFYVHPDHYRRTFRAWALALRTRADRATQLLGPDRYRTFARYFAGGEALFRLRQQTLYRAILTRRPEPKHWAVTVRPSDLDSVHDSAQGASPTAVEAHYDLSNAFYRLWLGPTMMYSSGMWEDVDDLESSLRHKVDFFSQALQLDASDRVLDVGCGWGWALRRLVREHGISDVTGLTLSKAQHDYVAADPVVGADVRLEDWKDHRPTTPYDAIMSFGAFEHFARDGSTGPERIAAYRRFFESCSDWLVPGGRLALETIAHDDAPDTDAPLGRGPLGDSVLSLYPESLCPHLSEVVLGFEPYFELDVLRSDGQDFARTCREWLLALRRREQEATELVGQATVRTFQSYLAASEIQFRTRIITNYRIVLRRRPDRRH